MGRFTNTLRSKEVVSARVRFLQDLAKLEEQGLGLREFVDFATVPHVLLPRKQMETIRYRERDLNYSAYLGWPTNPIALTDPEGTVALLPVRRTETRASFLVVVHLLTPHGNSIIETGVAVYRGRNPEHRLVDLAPFIHAFQIEGDRVAPMDFLKEEYLRVLTNKEALNLDLFVGASALVHDITNALSVGFDQLTWLIEQGKLEGEVRELEQGTVSPHVLNRVFTTDEDFQHYFASRAKPTPQV